jgi:hypothetical protein
MEHAPMKNQNRVRQEKTRRLESPETSEAIGGLLDAMRLEVADGGDDLGDALTVGFKNAGEAAVQEALEAGLAVPGRENG